MPKARSSSGLRCRKRAGLPSRSSTSARLTRSSCSLASLSLPLAFLVRLSTRFSRLSRSASINSVSMVSMSASGAILPSKLVMYPSSKHRTTLRDVGEKLFAEPLALGGAAHQACDIDKGQPGRNDLRRFSDLGQLVE